MAKTTALAIAAGLCTALLASCSSGGGYTGGGGYKPVDSSVAVVYTLTGSAAGADITYSVDSGGTEQQQGIGVPMMNKSGGVGLQFKASLGDFLYFSAQNNGEYGTLTCAITVDGRRLVEHRSAGAYSIVTCDGTA